MKRSIIFFSAVALLGVGIVFAATNIWNTTTIPMKNITDSVTHTEFNQLVQTTKGIFHDDVGTPDVFTDDRMGIGVASPQLSVDVAGAVSMRDSSVGCDSTTIGSIRFHDANKRMEFCNGTVWQTIALETS